MKLTEKDAKKKTGKICHAEAENTARISKILEKELGKTVPESVILDAIKEGTSPSAATTRIMKKFPKKDFTRMKRNAAGAKIKTHISSTYTFKDN